ncbi:MAG: anthranilate synthase component II [bacterium]
MKILVIDNYDSFTYNLVQYVGEIDRLPRVVRNDEFSLEEIEGFAPQAIIISPGPGRPEDAGVSIDVIRKFGEKVPVLGVCLGHQCLAVAFGGKIKPAARLVHGKTSQIYYSETPLYRELGNPFTATRYHSLIVSEDSFPAELSVDALSEEGEIMGLHHNRLPLLGVQFHPESILTNGGKKMIANFLDYAKNPFSIGKTQRPKIGVKR